MYRQVLILFILVLAATGAFADLDKSLMQEIAAWKKGMSPPSRLLKFPDGKIEPPVCGLRAFGEAVEDYIAEIKNVDLLLAIAVDPSATQQSSTAAAKQLVRLQGPAYLRTRLSEQDASTFAWPHVAVLRELLRSPYATVKVAKIDYKDMPQAAAEAAMTDFRDLLEKNSSWDAAYKLISEAHPDPNARPYGTLVCYCFDGVISPSGFDLLTYSVAKQLIPEHLVSLFRNRPRTALFRTPAAIYLYFVTAYAPSA